MDNSLFGGDTAILQEQDSEYLLPEGSPTLALDDHPPHGGDLIPREAFPSRAQSRSSLWTLLEDLVERTPQVGPLQEISWQVVCRQSPSCQVLLIP